MVFHQPTFPKIRFPKTLLSCAVFLSTIATSSADVEDAERWLPEFQPSTLDRAQQLAEMQWFIEAARPFAGMEIKVVSETITTHEYEAQVLAKAFTEITGIQVTHDLIGEGDVVEKLQTQMQSGTGCGKFRLASRRIRN